MLCTLEVPVPASTVTSVYVVPVPPAAVKYTTTPGAIALSPVAALASVLAVKSAPASPAVVKYVTAPVAITLSPDASPAPASAVTSAHLLHQQFYCYCYVQLQYLHQLLQLHQYM